MGDRYKYRDFSSYHYVGCYVNCKGEFFFRILTNNYTFDKREDSQRYISNIVQFDIPLSIRERIRYLKLLFQSYRKNKIRGFIRRLEKWT